MGRLIVYCDGCGERILEEDLDKGRAQQDAGRYYCGVCRPVTPPAASIPSPRAPTVRTQPMPKATSRHVVTPTAPAKSNTPIIAAGIVGALAVLGLVALMMGGGRKTADGPKTVSPNPPAAADPLEAQRKSVEAVEKYARENPGNPDETLKKCAEALRGLDASLRARVDDVRVKAEAAQKMARVGRAVEERLEKVREIAREDTDFHRTSSVRGQFDEARKAAAGVGALLEKVAAAEKEYEDSYHSAAGRAFNAVVSAAERAFAATANAIKAEEELDKFPLQFREGEWPRKIHELKKRYEERITREERKPDPKPEPRDLWEEYQRASRCFRDGGDYAEGARIMQEVFRRINGGEDLPQDQRSEIAVNGQYNVACYHSRDRKDVEQACRYLESSFKAGWRDWEHLDKDKDLDNIRGSAKFKDLVKQYRRRMIGVEGRDVVDEDAERLGLAKDQGGIVIARVIPGGVAEKGGVKDGDVFIELDGKKFPRGESGMKKLREIIDAVKEDADIPLVVLRDKQKVALKVRWPKKK